MKRDPEGFLLGVQAITNKHWIALLTLSDRYPGSFCDLAFMYWSQSDHQKSFVQLAFLDFNDFRNKVHSLRVNRFILRFLLSRLARALTVRKASETISPRSPLMTRSPMLLDIVGSNPQ